MDTLFSMSDITSLHLQLAPETLHMLNAETMARMKPGVFIINTSRGKLIDRTALIAALKSGHIGGVALAVYEEEEGIFFQDLSGQVLMSDLLIADEPPKSIFGIWSDSNTITVASVP